MKQGPISRLEANIGNAMQHQHCGLSACFGQNMFCCALAYGNKWETTNQIMKKKTKTFHKACINVVVFFFSLLFEKSRIIRSRMHWCIWKTMRGTISDIAMFCFNIWPILLTSIISLKEYSEIWCTLKYLSLLITSCDSLRRCDCTFFCSRHHVQT